METIALEFEICEKFIHSLCLFPDIDLVSKANKIKIGSLKVSLSYCGPAFEPQPMMGPQLENSLKEPASKRKTALSTKSNHSAAKYGKTVAVAFDFLACMTFFERRFFLKNDFSSSFAFFLHFCVSS